MISPHGGKIIDQMLAQEERERIIKNQDRYTILPVSEDQIKDVCNIAAGVYSPLTGFLRKADLDSVLDDMRLASGQVWSIPIVLNVQEKIAERLKDGTDILLSNQYGTLVALMKNIEIYKVDKKIFSEKVFGTIERRHPGVDEVFKSSEWMVGGDIYLIEEGQEWYQEYFLSPKKTREIFKSRGWNEVVGFQTRNVPHRGHEYLQKQALKQVDGLFIQPVIGRKKVGDFKDEVMLGSYEILIDKYFEKDAVVLGVLPVRMHYAGPREAVFHALIRKNFGCSHFIVGRDHAGVSDFYEPFAAQKIFEEFTDEEIGIEILKYPEVVYCRDCKQNKFKGECDHSEFASFSGTDLRKTVQNKDLPPVDLVRPEIFYLLMNNDNPLVDDIYHQAENKQQGFVLWFTGLSQSGKSTTANYVFEELKARGYQVERLDGDVVRKSLTADLGFSKEDRDENIRRVGYIAKLFSSRGVIVLASFISPYRKERDDLRENIDNFIEVYVNAPLEICESRDTRGLYKKARQGLIKNYTGIDDPYEAPNNPEIEIRTDEMSVKECRDKVIDFLEGRGLI